MPTIGGAGFCGAGGAVPIRVCNVGMVGTVAVSGRPGSEDYLLAIETLSWLGEGIDVRLGQRNEVP